MSNYTRKQIEQYANSKIKEILPLDDESVSQLVSYCIANLKTREAIYNHFVNLLGETTETFNFVSKFSDMLFGTEEEESKETGLMVKPTGTKSVKVVSTNGSRTKIVRTKVVNKANNWLDRDVKETSTAAKSNKQRLSSNKKGSATTSELFDLTPKRQERFAIKKSEQTKVLENLEEIDDVLIKLEIEKEQKSNSGDIRRCNCNATRHPLFEMYPNCLNCGKIICEKEGLQPCSYCGHDLMSTDERNEIINILKKEKEELEESQNKPKQEQQTKPKSKKNVMKISLNNVGQNNFKVQEQFFKMVEKKQEDTKAIEKQKEEDQKEMEDNEKELEYWNSVKGKDEELRKAEERLEMLLSFQDNSAERTKIIDNAADFDLPVGTGGSLWATPLERALQLKRQQKNAQLASVREDQRSGRGKKNVDIVIKDGKVIMRENKTTDSPVYDEDLSDDEEIKELKSKANSEKVETFNAEASKYYDYEKVESEYVKPKYLGNILQSTAKETIYPELGTIVQLGSAEDQEDALFALSGI